MPINYQRNTSGDRYYEAYSWNTARLTEYYPQIGTLTGLGETAIRHGLLAGHEGVLQLPPDQVQDRAQHLMKYAVAFTAQQERALAFGGPDIEVSEDHCKAARRILRLAVAPLVDVMAPRKGSMAQLRIALDIVHGQSVLVPSSRLDFPNFQAQTRTQVSHYVSSAIDATSRDGYSWATAEAMGEGSYTEMNASLGANNPLTFIIAEAEFIRRGGPRTPLAIQKVRLGRLAKLVEQLPNSAWLFSIPPVTLGVISEAAQILDGHRKLRKYVRQTIQKRK